MVPNLPCPCIQCIQNGREKERPKGLRSVVTDCQFYVYVGFIWRQFSGTVAVGFGRSHSRGCLLPQSCGSPCESQPAPPLWMATHTDRVIDGGIYSSGHSRCRLPATPGGEGTAQSSPDWLVSEELFPFRRGKGGRHSRVRTLCEAQGMAGICHRFLEEE